MIRSFNLDSRIDVDTDAKTVVLVLSVPAAEGEGDVDVFSRDVTADLSTDQRRRLRHLLISEGS